MKACRICLAMDAKLYPMTNYNLQTLYEEITGIIVSEEDKLPKHLCWECAHRVVTHSRFKDKALRSQGLMLEMLVTNYYITPNILISIDRHTNNLSSSLTYKAFNANHNDLHLHETYSKPETDITESETQYFEVKNEIEDDMNFDYNVFDSTSSDKTLTTHKEKVKRTKQVKKATNKLLSCPKIDRRKKPATEVLNEDIFSITDLSVEEQVMEIQKRQESSNYKRSEYTCEVCFKGFLDEDAYKCHMIRHTDQSGTYECDICKVRFKKRHALRNHVTSHLQKFSCKRCSYVTTRRHAAKLHEEYHNGTRYQCPHCQEDFGKFSTYMSHVRIKHPSGFVCPRCGHSFVSGKGLALHEKLKHRFDDAPAAVDGPHCIECDVRFATDEALDKHVKSSPRHHMESKENGSRTTDRRQHSTEDGPEKRDSLKKKNKGHGKPEGPIPCEQCDMQLPDSISYYRHFRRVHPDKNRTNYPSMKTKCMCEVCGKMFQSLALLQDHSFTHSDSKQFQCTQCDKTFQRKYRLIAHRRVHGAARAQHACAACGKRFSTASNMQRHMVSHTGLKPFKCEMCGKCFKHASEKRVHITYVHLKKPWPKRARGKRRTDGRPNQQQAVPSELDLVQPLWPGCSDPKMQVTMEDKVPMYYNLKI